MPVPKTRPDRIECDVLGQRLCIEVQAPCGLATLVDLIPVARTVADHLEAAAVNKATSQGKTVSCQAGCGICCRQLVGISAVEALALADLVSKCSNERRTVIEGRFERAVTRLEHAGMLDPRERKGNRGLVGMQPGRSRAALRGVSAKYTQLQIACPFLEDEFCSIYAERPMMCREYNVSSASALCATPYDSPVERITPPLHLGGPLARTAAQLTETPVTVMPLTLALEWSRENTGRAKKILDGESMYQAFLSQIDPHHQTPFEARDDPPNTSCRAGSAP